MSHWTRCKLKVTEKDTLIKALKRMGVEKVNDSKKIISQYGKSDTADVWVDEAVGFKQEKDGTFSMIGDFYHSKNKTLKEYYNRTEKFNTDLTVSYGIEDAYSKIEGLQMGFTESGKTEDSEYIRLEFTSYNTLG